MDVSAKITGITYSPFLGRELSTFNIDQLGEAISNDATFILLEHNLIFNELKFCQ